MYSKELLKGTLKTIILKLLADNGRMYGYQMTREVKDQSGDTIHLTEGALYPMLHKLEADGLVITEVENIGKRIRKYYKLSKKGQEAVKVKISEFEEFTNTLSILLKLKPST